MFICFDAVKLSLVSFWNSAFIFRMVMKWKVFDCEKMFRFSQMVKRCTIKSIAKMLKECDEWSEKHTQFWGKKCDWTNLFFSFGFFYFSFSRFLFRNFVCEIYEHNTSTFHDSLSFFPFSVSPPNTFHVTKSLSLSIYLS